MLKFVAKCIVRFLLHIFYIFPVNKRKIYFRAFHGTRYACNPKYLYLWLCKNASDFLYVWEVRQSTSLEKNTVRVNTILSVRGLFHVMQSRFIITNSGFPWWIPLRKSQIVLETWHGGGAYKRVGIYENVNSFFDLEQRKNAKQTTFYISSSRKFTEVQSPSKYVPPEKFIATGMPRNAIFFDEKSVQRMRECVRSSFKVPSDSKIVLYAPTYRGVMGFKASSCMESHQELGFEKLICLLKAKFGGEWIVFYRSHYFDQYLKHGFKDSVLDATLYEDMQELLCAADVLVTDYSSSMWDFALTKKPCFLYAPDLRQYIAERGFYTDPHSWPFPLAESEENLWKNIGDFDSERYAAAVQKHLDDFGSYENKDACEKVCRAVGIEGCEF